MKGIWIALAVSCLVASAFAGTCSVQATAAARAGGSWVDGTGTSFQIFGILRIILALYFILFFRNFVFALHISLFVFQSDFRFK